MLSAAEYIKTFRLNVPQARALTVMANEMWLPWGRGAGKTQGVIAPWILHKVEVMPRSSGGLVGQSFEDIETRILKPIFSAFTMQGLTDGVDYVYGRRPPEGWERPYIPVIKYDRVLSFPNGTTMELISLSKSGSANGLSLQWLIGDEAKFLKETKLKQEVFPILRGNVDYFGASPWYGAKLFVTDKLSPNIHWILAKKKLMDERIVNAVIYYQLQVNDLRQQMYEAENTKLYKLAREVQRLEAILAVLRKNLVYYGEASALDNIENLSPDYFSNQKQSMTAFEYDIQILNKDPKRAEKNFYPDRTERHLYNHDYDEDITQPLGVVFDYQASISPLVSFQVNDLVEPGIKTLNYLMDVYTLYPKGLKDVINEFCEYHRFRPCKIVYYFYDHTAVGRRNMHKKLYEEVIEYFRENDWTVYDFYMGQAPSHNDKFRRIKRFLSADTEAEHYPTRIHETRCATMVLSMDMAATKETTTEGTVKDKDNEKNLDYPQEQATHHSDCFDQVQWAVNELGLYKMHLPIPMAGGVRR